MTPKKNRSTQQEDSGVSYRHAQNGAWKQHPQLPIQSLIYKIIFIV